MLTFLFTDIEGSTRLWEEHTGVMNGIIARHDEILQEQIEAHGGCITKHTGDGIMAVFENGQPLACALEAQVRFAAEPWGEIGALPIRAGLHAGEAEYRVSVGMPRGDYFGPAVNTAARVMSAAWGGQILLTPDVTNISPLPPQASVLDLGEHLLKNVSVPQQIYQLLHPDLPQQQYPPPRTLSGQAIRRTVEQWGEQIAGMEPTIMAVTLTSATLAPAFQGDLSPDSLALKGNLGVLEDIGAGTLRSFVAAFAQRLRARQEAGQPLAMAEIQRQLQGELLDGWQASGGMALALRTDASRLLEAVHGVEATLEAGTAEVKEALARGLTALGGQFREFRWMLDGVQQVLVDIKVLQLEQLELQREQLAKTEELLERQPILPVLEIDAPVERPAFLDIESEAEEEERSLFVARERELARLDGYLEKMLSGDGLVVFVTGDPGRGKTMLLTEFAGKAMKGHPDLLVAKGNCNAYSGSGDPYLPFRGILSMLTGDVEVRWAAGSISLDHARRLWNGVPNAAQLIVGHGWELLETFVSGRDLLKRAGAVMDGDGGWLDRLRERVVRAEAQPSRARQSRLFEQYARVLAGIAAHSPLLLIVDDLQWADPGSIALLFHLGRRLAGNRILLAGAYRPEEVFPDLEELLGEFKRQFGEAWVDLGDTDDVEARIFVDELVDSEPNRLGHTFRQAMLQQTGGHALYSVELLRTLRERGDLVRDADGVWMASADLDWTTLPARVEGVIEKRVNRLDGDLKRWLEVASVEGEVFTAEVLAGVESVDSRLLVRRLSSELDREHQLVKAEGIWRTGGHRLSRYRFRHILFQRYLYDSMDEVERAYLHEDVGNALENLYGDETEIIAGELALHFKEADVPAKAVTYLQLAGELARRLSANAEAVAHFGAALELLPALPDTPERTKRELAIQLSLALSLMNLKGYSSTEAGQACMRARELCEQIGDAPRVTTALGLLSAHHFTRAEYGRALELAEELMSMTLRRERKARLSLTVANYLHAVVYLGMGELEKGLKHAEQAIANYSRHLDRVAIQEGGLNAAVNSRCFAGTLLQLSGYSDQSRQKLDEATALAQDDPYNLAWALFYLALVSKLRCDVRQVQCHATELISLTTEYGFEMFRAYGIIFQGWTMAMQGEAAEGLVDVRRGLAMHRARGTENYRSILFCLLAEVCSEAGQTAQGLAALNDAMVFVERTGERFCEAEIHRLRGELLLRVEGQMAKNEMSPEDCFLTAIKVARQQNAKFWELRATISLCRLWVKQGKREDAQQKLGEIYVWFTEGFDTPDLMDAKALLEELG